MDNLRDPIVRVLDDLNADLNINPTPEARISKLRTWHIALEGISDKSIYEGFKKIIKTDIRFLPSAGAFRKFCITRQTSNASTEEEKPYIPVSHEIGRKNAKNILNKLLSMGRK